MVRGDNSTSQIMPQEALSWGILNRAAVTRKMLSDFLQGLKVDEDFIFIELGEMFSASNSLIL